MEHFRSPSNHLQAIELQSIENARKFYHKILADPAMNTQSELWLEFISLEKFCLPPPPTQLRRPHSAQVCTGLYRRALASKMVSVMDWPERLMDSWQKFEREWGSGVDGVDSMVFECKRIRKSIESRRLADYSAATATKPSRPHDTSKRATAKVTNSATSDSSHHKRPPTSTLASKNKKLRSEPPAATPDAKNISTYRVTDPAKLALTIFVSNLSDFCSEEDLRAVFAQCGAVVDVRVVNDKRPGFEKTFAYVELSSVEEIERAMKLNRSPLTCASISTQAPRSMFVSRCRGGGGARNDADKGSGGQIATPTPTTSDVKSDSDGKTLFVTNLPPAVTASLLEDIFKEV